MLAAMARLRLSCILGLLVLLLSACSFRFMYNHVDLALIWRIDDFVDINASQRAFLQQRLPAHLDDYRDQMPAWRDFLLGMDQRIGKGVTEQDLQWFYNSLAELRNRLGRQLADDAARFLATVDEQQAQYMLDALDDENREMYERTQMSDEQRARERGRMAVEGIEEWTGFLTEPQRQRVRQLAAGLPDVTRPWYAYRLERQRQFAGLTRRAAAGEAVSEDLYAWFTAPRPPQFQSFLDAVDTMILEVDGLLNESQRRRLREKILDKVADVQSVIDDAPAPTPHAPAPAPTDAGGAAQGR